tara:strand:- start:40 stop:834 length:795 start_codon:yes stop_codon:yes gene_type:complete
MASFTDKKLSEVYKDILHTDNSNTGIDSNIKQIKCGDGDTSALYLSDRNFKAQPSTDSTTNSVICDADGNALLTVDSTNDLVKAGIGQHTVNTQYAYFGIGDSMQQTLIADTHYGIPFFGMAQKVEGWIADFGTGTDPDTSFTTADTLSQKGSQLAGLLWYVPDNISIDAVYSIEGADQATGDTTRMHLYSYTFNSGSTSALAGGTLLAHNSDVTNAGSEQVYLSTWTIDSANVAGGKVICAFFRSDSVNSDYTTNITVKYHLR